MKKIILVLLFALFAFQLFAQLPAALKNTSTLLWYGLDYSEARFTGTKEFSDPEINLHDYFDQWNQVFVDEQNKYNLQRAFDVEEIIMNIDQVKAKNASVNLTGKIIDEEFQLPYEQIIKIVDQYEFADQYGMAVIGIVESLNKEKKIASAYFTFIDLETNEIAYVKWMTGDCGGAGFRNYWINPFADMLEQFYVAFR